MRVVLDTNVLARPSFSKAGPAAELLDRLKAPDHVLIISPFIVSELERALRYPRLQRLHGFDDQALARYLADIEGASLLVDVPEGGVTAVSPDDPDDDPIVAAAVAGSAEVLCTRGWVAGAESSKPQRRVAGRAAENESAKPCARWDHPAAVASKSPPQPPCRCGFPDHELICGLRRASSPWPGVPASRSSGRT